MFVFESICGICGLNIHLYVFPFFDNFAPYCHLCVGWDLSTNQYDCIIHVLEPSNPLQRSTSSYKTCRVRGLQMTLAAQNGNVNINIGRKHRPQCIEG